MEDLLPPENPLGDHNGFNLPTSAQGAKSARMLKRIVVACQPTLPTCYADRRI